MAAVKTARKDDYIRLAEVTGAIMREHGAARCVDFWGDDVPVGEVTSFPRALKLEDDETVCVCWVEFPDRATRDACWEKVQTDPRMDAAMADSPMAMQRMIMGGFEKISES